MHCPHVEPLDAVVHHVVAQPQIRQIDAGIAPGNTYVVILRDDDEIGNRTSEKYFDANGQPQKGAAVIEYQYGDDGKVSATIRYALDGSVLE